MDDALDRLRLRLDMFPAGVYQPVPTLPFRHATRARGSESRWAAMSPLIQSLAPRQAVDVGADAGYFALQLGWLGVPTVAMDGDPRAQRTAMLAIRRSGLHTVAVTSLRLEPANVDLVPPADCVLVLSVWHHFVRDYGIEAATTMVQSIWAKTGKVMLFDTGESEMPPSFGLPSMVPDGRTWLRDYLAHACAGSRIEHLGRHAAFDAEGDALRAQPLRRGAGRGPAPPGMTDTAAPPHAHSWVWAVLAPEHRRVCVLGDPGLSATLREAGLHVRDDLRLGRTGARRGAGRRRLADAGGHPIGRPAPGGGGRGGRRRRRTRGLA